MSETVMEMADGDGSPVRFKIDTAAGDPGEEASPEPDPWLTEAVLSDVIGWVEASSYDPEVIAGIQQMMPAAVFQKLSLFSHLP